MARAEEVLGAAKAYRGDECAAKAASQGEDGVASAHQGGASSGQRQGNDGTKCGGSGSLHRNGRVLKRH